MTRAALLQLVLTVIGFGLWYDRVRRPARHSYRWRRASVATTWARRFTVHIDRTTNPRENWKEPTWNR